MSLKIDIINLATLLSSPTSIIANVGTIHNKIIDANSILKKVNFSSEITKIIKSDNDYHKFLIINTLDSFFDLDLNNFSKQIGFYVDNIKEKKEVINEIKKIFFYDQLKESIKDKRYLYKDRYIDYDKMNALWRSKNELLKEIDKLDKTTREVERNKTKEAIKIGVAAGVGTGLIVGGILLAIFTFGAASPISAGLISGGAASIGATSVAIVATAGVAAFVLNDLATGTASLGDLLDLSSDVVEVTYNNKLNNIMKDTYKSKFGVWKDEFKKQFQKQIWNKYKDYLDPNKTIQEKLNKLVFDAVDDFIKDQIGLKDVFEDIKKGIIKTLDQATKAILERVKTWWETAENPKNDMKVRFYGYLNLFMFYLNLIEFNNWEFDRFQTPQLGYVFAARIYIVRLKSFLDNTNENSRAITEKLNEIDEILSTNRYNNILDAPAYPMY